MVNPNECRIINPGLKRFLLLKLQCSLFPPRHHNSSASFTKDPQWGPVPFPHRANREPALTPWRKQRISRVLIRYRQLSAHQCLASLRTPHECTLIRRAREMRTVCKHAHTFVCATCLEKGGKLLGGLYGFVWSYFLFFFYKIINIFWYVVYVGELCDFKGIVH